jgi:hypothetical protein
MIEEHGLIDWLTKGLMATLMAIIAFFTKQVVADVSKLKEQHKDCQIDLANFKTQVANEYAKETTVQQSLTRIHDRIDYLTTVAVDIKNFLGKVK